MEQKPPQGFRLVLLKLLRVPTARAERVACARARMNTEELTLPLHLN